MFTNHLSVPISKQQQQQQTTFGPLSNRMFHSDFPRYSSMIPSPLDIAQPISAVGAATTITTYTPVENVAHSATASTNTTQPTANSFPSFRKSFTVLDHGQVGIQEMISEEQHICQQQMKAAAKTLQHQSNGRFVMLTFVDDCLQATELPTDGAINSDDEFTTESNTTIGTATATGAGGEQQAAPQRVLYTVRYDQIVMFKISRKDRSFLYFCARRPRPLMLDDCGDEATNEDISTTEVNNNNNKQCRKSLFGSNSDNSKTETGGTDSGYQYNCYIYHATNSGAALRIYNLLKHSFILVQKMAKTVSNSSGSSLQSVESTTNAITQVPTTTTATLASKLQTPFIGGTKIRNKKNKTKSNNNLDETIRNDDDDDDSQTNNSNAGSNSNPLLLTIDNLLSNNVDETTECSNSNVLLFDQLSMNDSNTLQSSSSVSTSSSSSVQSNPTGHTSSVDLLASLIVPPPPPPTVQQPVAPSMSVSFSQQHQQYANMMSQYLNEKPKPMMMATSSIGEQSQQAIMSKTNPFLNPQMAVPCQPMSNSFNSNPFLNHHHHHQQQQQQHVYPSGFPTISNFPKALAPQVYSGGASIASNQHQAHMPDIVSSHTTSAPSVAPYPGPNYSHQNFVQKSSEQPLFNSNFNDFLSQTVKKHFHKQPMPTIGQRHLSSTISLEQESNLLL